MRLGVVVLLSVAAHASLTAQKSGCNADPSAPRANVTMLTTIPLPTSWRKGTQEPHLFEIMLALGENSRNAEVGEIRVLLDSGPPVGSEDFAQVNKDWNNVDDVATGRLRADVLASQSALAEKLDVLASHDELTKLTAHVYRHQPTYAELFRYASDALPHRLVALTNADIVLRNTHLLDASAFQDFSLVLTVREPTGAFGSSCARGRIRDLCVNFTWAGFSYDGFVFNSPLVATARYSLLEEAQPTPVYMNEMGAENRAKHFLAASGYELANPCLNRLAEHWHCTPKMHHQTRGVDPAHASKHYMASRAVKVAKDTRGLRCPS
mmetsp:Transcript_12177/g.36706  ORF Transcript_12177/g.36706 Transcript_12177/m.36706 type:complete len:323 (-) Transcript_12177:67-1035(-)